MSKNKEIFEKAVELLYESYGYLLMVNDNGKGVHTVIDGIHSESTFHAIIDDCIEEMAGNVTSERLIELVLGSLAKHLEHDIKSIVEAISKKRNGIMVQ